MVAAAMTNSSEKQSHDTAVRFMLWLMIIGIIMLFAAFTSAMIVRMKQGNFAYFELPVQFLYSCIVVVISSLSMWWAYRSAKRDILGGVQIGLGITLLLGLTFCYFQYLGWLDMFNRGIVFSPSPEQTDQGFISASFVILIASLHFLHITGGIIFLAYVLIKSFLYKVHKKSILAINMCNTYWHFVGFLWVYLYLFFYFAPQF